jgi:hypothetical protein
LGGQGRGLELGVRVGGLGLGVQGWEFRVWGLGFGVKGLGSRVECGVLAFMTRSSTSWSLSRVKRTMAQRDWMGSMIFSLALQALGRGGERH